MSTFPIMSGGRGAAATPHPMRIPWDIAEEAYTVYVSRFGNRQSLARIAERGGFYAEEMDDMLPGWRRRVDRAVIATVALETLGQDIHNELARIRRGGRFDIETMAAWESVAIRVIESLAANQ